MPEWIIAMFLIGALLSAGDMAKIFGSQKKPPKRPSMTIIRRNCRWSTTRFVPRSGRELYQMPSKV